MKNKDWMKYPRLWLTFLKFSWMADIEYRVNITVRVFGEVIWYVSQLSVFEVLYLHADAISGWDVHAMRVFMGSLFLVDNLYMILFQENMDFLNSIVRKGDLDLYLVKPVNSQFMVSFRKVATAYWPNFLIVLAYLSWAIHDFNHPLGLLRILTFAALIGLGLVSYYSLRFLFATLVIFLQDAGNIQFVWHQLFRLATRPDPIYPGYLRLLVLTLFPVGFMASVPARVLVEGFDPVLLLAAPAVAFTLLYLSHRAWHGALRHYASASS
jgi:ABC-2 type transport system permease protein